MTELFVLVMVLSGLIVAIAACGIIMGAVMVLIWHFFPKSAAAKWIREEFTQEDYLICETTNQDWIARRMSK